MFMVKSSKSPIRSPNSSTSALDGQEELKKKKEEAEKVQEELKRRRLDHVMLQALEFMV